MSLLFRGCFKEETCEDESDVHASFYARVEQESSSTSLQRPSELAPPIN
jgi:hypothetical protein